MTAYFRLRTITLVGVLFVSSSVPAASQARTVRISPSVVLRIDRDPIEDTDNSRITIDSSPEGVEANAVISCSGRYADAYVHFEKPENGSALILRFGTERPDTFPQSVASPMRVWGEGSVRMVTNAPTGIARIPRTAHDRFVRGLRNGTRMVARLKVDGFHRDAFFEVTGAARATAQLPCLTKPAPPAPQVLGRAPSNLSYDADPEPADSAATAQGLDDLRPAINRGFLDYVLVHTVVNAQGGVDSVTVLALGDTPSEEQIEQFVRTIRFRPAQREGRDVPSSLLFYLYKSEALPSRRR